MLEPLSNPSTTANHRYSESKLPNSDRATGGSGFRGFRRGFARLRLRDADFHLFGGMRLFHPFCHCVRIHRPGRFVTNCPWEALPPIIMEVEYGLWKKYSSTNREVSTSIICWREGQNISHGLSFGAMKSDPSFWVYSPLKQYLQSTAKRKSHRRSIS